MSTASNNVDVGRPWYRPHRESAVVALFAAVFVVMMNASGFVRVDGSSGLQWQRGWPFAFSRSAAQPGQFYGGFFRVGTSPAVAAFQPSILLADLMLGTMIVAGVMSLAERRIKRQRKLLQISLRELLVLTTLACIVIGKEVSAQRRQRESIERLFGTNCRFDADEGLPDWLRGRMIACLGVRPLGQFPLQPFDRVTAATVYGPHCAGERLAPLANFDQLVALWLVSESVNDDSLRYMEDLSRLIHLSIESSNVTDMGVAHLAGLSQLRFVRLGSMPITGASLQHLSSLRRLESLDLSDTFIDDGSLAHLRELPALQNLRLSFTPIGDRGLRHLAACRRLRVLELAGTRITNQGLLALAALGQLEELDVRDTCASDAGVARLHEVLPTCTILSGRR